MSDVLVLGAGIAGVSAALALQERSRDVVLIDRGPPGRETSHGNAGIIQAEAVEPYAMPRGARALLRVALGRDNSVSWHAGALPGQAAALMRYWWQSAPRRHREVAALYCQLIARATGAHGALIAAAGPDAEALIRREGFRQAYRDVRSLDADLAEAERLARDYGVRFEALDGAALARAEPELLRPLAGALHWTDPWSCSDPGGLVAAYADLFVRCGGTLLKGDAATLTQDGAGWRVETEAGGLGAAEAVVALGPWSPRLLARFGYRIPMVGKRGYHRHHPAARGPRLPMLDAALSAMLSPMRAGLRVLTAAELAPEGARTAPRQLLAAEAGAAELFDIGPPEEVAPWSGVRPCLPDMLPAVGQAPRHAGLWFHFGHGHQGFTLGPATGALLTAAMSGEACALTEALSPGRASLR